MYDFSCFGLYLGVIVRVSALLIAIPILFYLSKFLGAAFSRRFSRHSGVLINHAVLYGGMVVIGISLLHEFGFNVAALLGAAGIIGIAVGFASQTSVSNIISGFFLLLEHPFSVGDLIKSGDIMGIAESIDLLAVRVRTQDNKLVRIPNEVVLKNSLTNFTHYAIRRIDVIVSFPYAVSISMIKERISDIIAGDKLFLTSPAPVVVTHKIGQLDFDTEMRNFLSVRVWVIKEQFSRASGILIEKIKAECDQDGIVITVLQLNASS